MKLILILELQYRQKPRNGQLLFDILIKDAYNNDSIILRGNTMKVIVNKADSSKELEFSAQQVEFFSNDRADYFENRGDDVSNQKSIAIEKGDRVYLIAEKGEEVISCFREDCAKHGKEDQIDSMEFVSGVGVSSVLSDGSGGLKATISGDDFHIESSYQFLSVFAKECA